MGSYAAYMALGCVVGLACAALLTPGERFFGRWDLRRLAAVGKFTTADGSPWDGRDSAAVTSVDLSDTDVRPRDMAAVCRLPNLRSLAVAGCRIGDDWLRRIESLERLNLAFTGARGRYWTGADWPRLRLLYLVGANLGRRVELLGLHPTLEYLDLKLVTCPRPSLASLARQRPDVSIAMPEWWRAEE